MVKVEELLNYLIHKRWRIEDFPNDKLYMLTKNEETLFFPRKDGNEFSNVFEKIAYTISAVDNIRVDDLINELTSINADSIQIRIVNEETNKKYSIPMEYAKNVVDGIHDFILYSIAAERLPVKKQRLEKADYVNLERFLFNQTQKGSFIFSISTKEKITFYETNSFFKEKKSNNIETEAIKRMQKSLDQIILLANNKADIEEVVETSYMDGLTYNIADSLSKLEPSEINTIVNAHIWKSGFEVDKKNYILKDKEFKIISKVKEVFSKIENDEISISGSIYLLKDEVNENGKFEIGIVAEYDNKDMIFKVPLNKLQFEYAKKAYYDQKMISISGILDKSRRPKYIINIKELK